MGRLAQYGPAPVPDTNGNPMPGVAVTVTVPSGPMPGLFTDLSAATPLASPVTTDSSGMLTFCGPSGSYGLSWPVGNAVFEQTVTIQAMTVDPAEYVSDDATKGIVLKDAVGHYWRGTVNTSGVLAFVDLGTTRPAA